VEAELADLRGVLLAWAAAGGALVDLTEDDIRLWMFWLGLDYILNRSNIALAKIASVMPSPWSERACHAVRDRVPTGVRSISSKPVERRGLGPFSVCDRLVVQQCGQADRCRALASGHQMASRSTASQAAPIAIWSAASAK
jgi:hypothetical protein